MDLEDEKTLLLQRDAEWARISAEGRDIDRILSYWTGDAVVIPPGQPPVVGQAALREYVRSSLAVPGFRITWISTDVRISPDGNLAYMLGENSVTLDDADGRPVTIQGRGVTVWRRDPDNLWRCAVDIWNAGPAA